MALFAKKMEKPPTHLDVAKDKLALIGRLMVRRRHGDFWEEETRTLPRGLRRLRRRYKKFADELFRPLALAVDRDPASLDKERLFREYAARGLATELLPWPLGTMKWGAVRQGGLIASMLKTEELAAACPGLTVMVGAHDLGMGPLLVSGSWDALRRWVLPTYRRLRRGEKCVWAFAITEPGAGSDVEDPNGAMKARVVTRARKVAAGYRISGRKVFISGGAVADYVTLFACLGDEGLESWTCFVVEKGMKGFSVGRVEKKMGQKACDAAELVLDDVFVPEVNRVGPERAGWAINQLTLTASRPVVGGVALGVARGAFERCLAFCCTARQGSRRLVEFQEVQLELAEMMTRIMAARALVWNTALRYLPPLPGASAAAKVFASDTAAEISSRALSLMSDHSYLHSAGVEKALRDARVTRIYEGTNEMNRLALFADLMEDGL
ncbi:MAG TPA: acyl-CoA dehydrogenase family protein [bacterium]|nr:acyl-CoA dehydrogenase family protein [bacterium]